jgi:pimeloyl-ACP methyl ester carboxylesterase
MGSARVATLEVPGATLHYEVQGAGPLLLIIPGMPADAGLYGVLARQLADGYTVASYDPRGMSRSRLDGPATDQLVEVHAEDARRVLDAVGGGPAHVLTDSISGLVGLHLAATEPGRVRTLVTFEPPVTEVLPDRERWRAFFEDLHDTYRAQGLYPALGAFADAAGLDGGEPPDPDPDPETAAAMARIDRDASAPHQVAWQAAHALAEQLGVRPVTVPGDHDAVTRRPGEFAQALRTVLSGS